MASIFIRFLYCWTSISLEDLCDKRHFGSARVSELYLTDASVIGKLAQRTLAHERGGHPRSTEMLDIVMLAIGLGFFALSVGYAMACDQL
jgi:hypothetical protein